MQSRWNDAEARAFAEDDLAMRVYTSRLLGADEDLVMHGGGNTSVKSRVKDFFGDEIDVLFVKGSGWDLKTIEKPGFPALRLAETQRLAELSELSDLDMARLLRTYMLNPSSPSPSVEAILHAIMPAKFVDHTHTDAVVTLTNMPSGEAVIRELYPDCVVLPYVMPGFILAKQVYDALREHDVRASAGIILLHHGVFTFDDDARAAYERMIELVERAERYITQHAPKAMPEAKADVNLLDLARIRCAVSKVRGRAQLAVLDRTPDAQGYASREDVAAIATRGPITPDHVIRTKRVPAVIEQSPADGVPEIAAYVEAYTAYYNELREETHTMLDPAPRVGVWRGYGTISFGSSLKECRIADDITRHTRRAIQTAEQIDKWEALTPREIFEVEYWSLEQAKLNKPAGPPKPHMGKVAIVSGAHSGIGRAACEVLRDHGATVVGLDLNDAVVGEFEAAGMLGIACDVTDDDAVRRAIEATVERFGGLDILVCNAGIFRTGERIEAHTADTWDKTIRVNLTAAQRLITAAAPYLKLGIEASILIVASRNVAAPGPGAAAYSVSKAGLTQLARVAAIELAPDGVRVNVVHPDAVFDTALWTDDVLKRSAERYGMSVQEYKTKNLLKVEIASRDVAAALSALASPTFRATTGAQIPIDGGNDRVI